MTLTVHIRAKGDKPFEVVPEHIVAELIEMAKKEVPAGVMHMTNFDPIVTQIQIDGELFWEIQW